MDDTLRERMLKLYHLAQQGVGGEATNAEEMLNRLLEEHGISLHDLDPKDEKLVRLEHKYNDPMDRDLFHQVTQMVVGGDGAKIYRYNRTRTLFVEVTLAQRVEILVRYDLLRKALKEEIATMFTAFIIKHRLFNPDGQKQERTEPLTEKEKRALKMVNNLKDVALNKRLEDNT